VTRARRWLSVLLLAGLVHGPGAAVRSWAADPNKMIQAGLKLYEKGNYDKALKQFVKTLRLDPNNSVAREYMLLCSQKIVEARLGTSVAETVEKEINVEKQIQELNAAAQEASAPPPAAAPAVDTDAAFARALAEPALPAVPEPDAEPAPEVPAAAAAAATPEIPNPPDWLLEEAKRMGVAVPGAAAAAPGGEPVPDSAAIAALPGMERVREPAEPATSSALTAPVESILSPAAPAPVPDNWALPATPSAVKAPLPVAAPAVAAAAVLSTTGAAELIQRRDALAEELRRRHLGLENVVELEERGGRLEVTFFMNRLFLPYSDVLRDDAYPILAHVIDRMKAVAGRDVAFQAVDSATSENRRTMPDLSSKRCAVLFSYLVYNSLGRPPVTVAAR
jgi:hypothetical protein